MAKKDDIILIIAKAFAKERFTEEETKISKELTITTLIAEYGLNDIQAKEVIKWCVLSCASLGNKREVLEENFFKNLFKRKKSGINFDLEVRKQIEVSQTMKDSPVGEFLNRLNNLKSLLDSQNLERSMQDKEEKEGSLNYILNKELDIEEKEKVVSPLLSKELNGLLNKLKALYFATKNLPRQINFKNERVNRNKQFQAAASINRNTRYMNSIGKRSDHARRYRSMSAFVDLLCKNIGAESEQDKSKVIDSLLKYIKELHNEIYKIYKTEKSISTSSHFVDVSNND